MPNHSFFTFAARATILACVLVGGFVSPAMINQAHAAAAENWSPYPGFGDPGARGAGGGGNPGGGLVAAADTIDGGKIPIGATAQVVVRFRNDGSQPVETGLIRLYPSSTVSASVAMNQCEEAPLASGAECAIALSVKGLQAGPWRVEMLMSHSGRTRLVTAAVSGSVEASADAGDKLTSDIQMIPDELDFGTLEGSQTITKPVVLRNITSNPIDITDMFIDSNESSGYSLKTECKKLEAGQSCIAVVTWSPKIKGTSSGVLVAEHTGPAALSSVPLTGDYSPASVSEAEIFPEAMPGKGLLVASQTELDFGGDVTTASTITVSLVNVGDTALTISDIKISGSDNGLSYKEDGCTPNTVLEPIEACPLTVTWSPTRVGSIFDDVQVAHDGVRGVLVLPIRGSATSTVSQDQKSIVLSDSSMMMAPNPGPPSPPVDGAAPPEPDIEREQAEAILRNMAAVGGGAVNAASVLDGYRITSFSPSRAIINGPGGSRIVFDNEEIVLGGIPWLPVIQKNGIEFNFQGQRILLLFDRSLSSINRISASSDSGSGSSSGSSSTSDSGSSAESTPEPAPVADDTSG